MGILAPLTQAVYYVDLRYLHVTEYCKQAVKSTGKTAELEVNRASQLPKPAADQVRTGD